MNEKGFSLFSLFTVTALSEHLLMSGFGCDLLHGMNSMQTQFLNQCVTSSHYVYFWCLLFISFQTHSGQPSVLWGSDLRIWIGTLPILYGPAYVAVRHFDRFWIHSISGSSNLHGNGIYYYCLIVCTWDRRRRRDHDYQHTKLTTLSDWALFE